MCDPVAGGGIDRLHQCGLFSWPGSGGEEYRDDAGVVLGVVQVPVGLLQVDQPVGEPVGDRAHAVPFGGQQRVGDGGGQVLVVLVGRRACLEHLQVLLVELRPAVGDGVV